MEQILDKIGKEITVGSYIAYGHSIGNSSGLRIGKVLSTAKRDRGCDIVVIGIDDDHKVFYPIKLNSRPGYLQYPERIIVIPESLLSEEYKKLFEGKYDF